MKKRKDGLYQKSITLPDGRRKFFYGHSQAEITRKIAAWNYEAEQGPFFSEVAEEWEEQHSQNVRYSTIKTCEAPLHRAIQRFEGVRLKEIGPKDVIAYIRTVEATGVSKRTVQLYRDVLSMIFDFAIGKEIVTFNPCVAITLSPGLSKTTRSLPDQADIEAIKAHRGDDRFSLLPFLLLYTGMRLGEALALRREDFDLKGNRITVNKKISWQPNQPVVDRFTKTERGERTVPLLNPLKDSLPEWQGFLFGGDQPYTKQFFRRAWERYQKATGVKCDRHSLRHEFVTLMYDAGLEAPDAAQITGHDVTVMQRTYLHIRRERQEENAAKLNKFLEVTEQ